MKDRLAKGFVMRYSFMISTSDARVRKTAQSALSFLFVLVVAICINNVALSRQSFGQEPQNNGSANADDSAQNDGSNNNADSSANNDEDAFEPIRLTKRDDGLPTSLDTSVVRYSGRYRGEDGETRDVYVDLVGAVHIAEKSYYDAINESFKDYETVVFELVTDSDDVAAMIEEAKEKKKEKRNYFNPLNYISYFQEDSAKFLRLAYQMDGIDYAAENLRRGDCGGLEFILMTIKNGDVVDFFVEIFAQSLLSSTPGSTEGGMIALLCAKDRRLVARRLFAVELAESSFADFDKERRALDEGNAEGENKPRESAIIHLRNKKALAVVRDELDKGRERVALFFGAAHLPDLGKHLEEDFGLNRQPEVRWFKAWNLEKIEE